MLRPCNPADIVGLLILQARAEPNSAYGKLALAIPGEQRFPSFSGLVGEWLPTKPGRHTWILSQRGLPVGIVSVHRRKGAGNWEIDRLQVARGKEPASVQLLDKVGVLLGKTADRLFLRVAADSHGEIFAREAGFSPLLREALYTRPPGPLRGTNGSGSMALRPATPADALALFRLYTKAVPAAVRQAEGVGLRDWEASLNGNSGLPREQSWVIEQDGQLLAAATTSKGAGERRLLDLLGLPMEQDSRSAFVRGVVERLGERAALLCLLPEYQLDLRQSLEEHGFNVRAMFHVYVKPVLARARRTGLLPVGI